MKKSWVLWLVMAVAIVLVIVSAGARSGVDATASQRAVGVDAPTGAVLVDLVDGADAADRGVVGGELDRAIAPYAWPSGEAALGEHVSDPAQLFRVRAPASEVADIIALLRADPRVEGVEVERSWSLPASESSWAPLRTAHPRDGEGFHPNDPYYDPYQWHLDQIGMPGAWSRANGSGAVVAVIDTGVAYRNGDGFMQAPDLAGTTFVPGWDFVGNDAFPDDDHGHGTHCAGTIAQSTNNGVGVAGVAPGASIMPLKVLDRGGSGSWGAISAAIRWAADHGANVISMSLGGGSPSRTVQRAIDYAHEKGVLVVAAAGNSGRDRVEYPARHDHVLSVGAVRYDRELTFYSNYGEGLDIVAPGGDLRVDQNEDGMPDGVLQNTLVGGNPREFDYLAWQGTSMATPHVAGVAALLYGAGLHDPDAIERILKESAADMGDVRRYGSGLVRADNALDLVGKDAAGARAGLALFFVLALGFALRRRKELAVGILPTALVATLVAGGLGLLPMSWTGARLGEAFSEGLLGSLGLTLGSWGALLVCTALPAFAAVALGYHIKAVRPALVGFSLASAAFLVVEALWPTLQIALLPSFLVGPWLVLNALGAAGLGWLVARNR